MPDRRAVPTFDLVFVGGGLASASAIASYRAAGGDGSVALLSAEPDLPYHRPPLTKRFLRGELTDAPLVADAAFYADAGVEVLLETEVEEMSLRERRVGGVGFRRLVVATGVEPRRLSVPGAQLDGVVSLRTLRDARALREAARPGARAVVVGGGFIGLETAASLRQLGLEVTVLEGGPHVLAHLGLPQLSDELAQLHRDRGVEIVLGDTVESIVGGASVEGVRLGSGRTLPADVVVVGIGVTPVTAPLAGSGVEIGNGIVVDEQFRTTAPDVFAIGDVASVRGHRIEHWANAKHHGDELGRILAGGSGGYGTVSSFFTEMHGTVVKVFGDTRGHDEVEVRGSVLDGGKLVALFGADGALVAATVVGQPEETETGLKELVAARSPLDRARELTAEPAVAP